MYAYVLPALLSNEVNSLRLLFKAMKMVGIWGLEDLDLAHNDFKHNHILTLCNIIADEGNHHFALLEHDNAGVPVFLSAFYHIICYICYFVLAYLKQIQFAEAFVGLT